MDSGRDAVDVDGDREPAPPSGAPSSAAPDPASRTPEASATPDAIDDSAEPETPFSIDSVVPNPWSSECRRKLSDWQQGDLLQQPGISWLGPSEADEITGMGASSWDYEPVASPGLTAPYGVIASQTCDIGATGPGAKHPFVEVYPVFDMSDIDPAKQQQIRQFSFRYLVALTSTLETPGFWVADLRLVLSVSKAHLLKQSPINGFETQQDRLNFAEVLAVKHRRAALHDELSEGLPKILDDHIKNKDRREQAPDWHEGVDQVRLDITGERLRPESVTVVIVSDHSELSVADRAIWREADGAVEGVIKRAGCKFGGWSFTNLDAMSARRYRNTVPIDLKQLKRSPSW